MRRSGGVTAAAIVLFVGSGLLILLMGLTSLTFVLPKPSTGNAVNPLAGIVFGVVFYGMIAAWGIVTAVGILRLGNWARISILVMAGFSIACTLFSVAMMIVVVPMMSQMPGMRSGIGAIVVGLFLVMMAIPFGISIWWLVLFLRKSVRLQFAGGEVGPMAESVAAFGAGQTVGVPASGAVDRNQVQPRAGMSLPATKTIPTSIIVIAVFLLIGAALTGLSVPMAIQGHFPFLLMGVLAPSRAALAIVVIMGAIELFLGIALLRRQSWSLDVTTAFAVFGILNCSLFLVSPSRADYFRIMLANYPSPPGTPPEMFPNLMHSVLQGSMGFSIVVNLVALYFLVTRRKAYREACAGKL
jgi:hypothetical protein